MNITGDNREVGIMTNLLVTSNTERFEVRTTVDSHFGWIRTRLSLKNTMMSDLRTAISLVGFGFAIVQFYERLDKMPGASPAYIQVAPQYLGLTLIGAGVLTLVIAISHYRWGVHYLWSNSFASIAVNELQSPQLAIAILLVLVGLSAFLAVRFRLA